MSVAKVQPKHLRLFRSHQQRTQTYNRGTAGCSGGDAANAPICTGYARNLSFPSSLIQREFSPTWLR